MESQPCVVAPSAVNVTRVGVVIPAPVPYVTINAGPVMVNSDRHAVVTGLSRSEPFVFSKYAGVKMRPGRPRVSGVYIRVHITSSMSNPSIRKQLAR